MKGKKKSDGNKTLSKTQEKNKLIFHRTSRKYLVHLGDAQNHPIDIFLIFAISFKFQSGRQDKIYIYTAKTEVSLGSSVMIAFIRCMIFGIARQRVGTNRKEINYKKIEARNIVPRTSKSNSASDFSFSFTSGRRSVLYVLAPCKPKKIKTS